MCKKLSNSAKCYIKTFVVLVIFLLLVIFGLLLVRYFMPGCDTEGLVVSLIAAVASIVVIGNFSQVAMIKDDMKNENENVKMEMDDKIGALKLDIEKLNNNLEEIREKMKYEDDEGIKEKDGQRICLYYHDRKRPDPTNIVSLNPSYVYRFYLVVSPENKYKIFMAGAGLVKETDESDYLRRASDKEREKWKNELDELKESYGLK